MNDQESAEQRATEVINQTLDAMSQICEPFGVKFEFDCDAMSLEILMKEERQVDIQAAEACMIASVSATMSALMELISFSTKDQPLRSRHTELHKVFMEVGDILGRAFEVASQNASGDIEIAKSFH